MLELLACKPEQIQNSRKKGCYRSVSLKPGDRERVRHAAKLLEQQMENPTERIAITRNENQPSHFTLPARKSACPNPGNLKAVTDVQQVKPGWVGYMPSEQLLST